VVHVVLRAEKAQSKDAADVGTMRRCFITGCLIPKSTILNPLRGLRHIPEAGAGCGNLHPDLWRGWLVIVIPTPIAIGCV